MTVTYLTIKNNIIPMNLNTEIFYSVNHGLSNPFFDFVMPKITDLGGLTFMAILCVVLLILTRKNIFGLGKYYGLAKLFAAAILLTVIITAPLKLLFEQPRPSLILDNVNALTTSLDPNSFPSGHSATTLSVMTVLFIKARDYFKNATFVRCFAVVFSAIICFSRIYIGMHFPFDVITGAAIGIVSGYLACRFLKV